MMFNNQTFVEEFSLSAQSMANGPDANELQDGVQVTAGPVTQDDILSAINGEDVAVYVYSATDLGGGLRDIDYANEVKAITNSKIVIVQNVDTGRFAILGDTQDGAIQKVLSTEQDLIAGVATASGLASEPAVSLPGADSGGFDALVGGGVVLAVAAGVAAAAVVVKRNNRIKKEQSGLDSFNKNKTTTDTGSIQIPLGTALPPEIKTLLEQMNDVIRLHHEKRDKIQETLQAGGETEVDLETLLGTTANHIQEVFVRLEKKGSNDKKRVAAVEYKDRLQKIVEGVGPDYFLDIAENPDYWDNPTQRMVEVHDAVEMVNLEARENIKKINASKDLEFRYVLNALAVPKNTSAVSDIYKNNQGDQ